MKCGKERKRVSIEVKLELNVEGTADCGNADTAAMWWTSSAARARGEGDLTT